MTNIAAVADRIEDVEREVDSLLVETQEQTRPEKREELVRRVEEIREEFAYQVAIAVLESEIKLIETLSKEVLKFRDDSRYFTLKLLKLREKSEIRKRRLQLLKPLNSEDFRVAIMWMAEQGEREDLCLIEQVKADPPLTSEDIENLIHIAELMIIERNFDHQGELQNFYALNQDAFIRAIGADNWTDKIRAVQSANDTIENLRQIKEALESMFPPNEINRWLSTAKTMFSGKTPIELIVEGQSNKVLEILVGLEEGIHN